MTLTRVPMAKRLTTLTTPDIVITEEAPDRGLQDLVDQDLPTQVKDPEDPDLHPDLTDTEIPAGQGHCPLVLVGQGPSHRSLNGTRLDRPNHQVPPLGLWLLALPFAPSSPQVLGGGRTLGSPDHLRLAPGIHGNQQQGHNLHLLGNTLAVNSHVCCIYTFFYIANFKPFK